ncbi:MAG: PIN domain-containing protein [Streptosporangiales bacterium]|nr:PIN domain-containing protein [Streptosporangiales bacterium]
MMLPDVNVLVNAYRPENPGHKGFRTWLDALVNGAEAYAVTDSVINALIRITTDRRIYRVPSRLEEVLGFADLVRNQDHAIVVNPGERHWEIFTRLCEKAGARGKLVADAYLAALAIEHGCEFISADRDFARFPGLRWRHPLD